MTFDNEKYKKYSDHYNCLYEKMWYSADEKRFVCLGGEGEINEAKRLYLMDYVIKNFDDISPITHINTYKRDYINHYSRIIETSDWDFRNLNWRDKDTLEIEFGDMSLNLWVSLDATETET
ncbi:MAG: hypothetical protein LBC61_05380 [Candidatus Peribacteria bacterium]|jgi:succinate dehydrogenase flavin-adding protein (antitoxin of CptAB toxin-antitoxin module)|nr:hypothetical protein [Candidatus Peribacteria bacterium]